MMMRVKITCPSRVSTACGRDHRENGDEGLALRRCRAASPRWAVARQRQTTSPSLPTLMTPGPSSSFLTVRFHLSVERDRWVHFLRRFDQRLGSIRRAKTGIQPSHKFIGVETNGL